MVAELWGLSHLVCIFLEIFNVVQQPVVHSGAVEVQVCAVLCSALQKICKALQGAAASCSAGLYSALQPRPKPAVWRRARGPDYWLSLKHLDWSFLLTRETR